jgi:hypothetical protein
MKKINLSGFGILLMLLLSVFLLTSCTKPADAQSSLFMKKDSVKCGVDTVAQIDLNGNYEKLAFTLTNATTVDTLKPQVRYTGTNTWVTASVKNIRLQTSDTNIILAASSWPASFEVNDPVIDAFRLFKPSSGTVASRITYVYFRAWRR